MRYFLSVLMLFSFHSLAFTVIEDNDEYSVGVNDKPLLYGSTNKLSGSTFFMGILPQFKKSKWVDTEVMYVSLPNDGFCSPHSATNKMIKVEGKKVLVTVSCMNDRNMKYSFSSKASLDYLKKLMSNRNHVVIDDVDYSAKGFSSFTKRLSDNQN